MRKPTGSPSGKLINFGMMDSLRLALCRFFPHCDLLFHESQSCGHGH